MGFTVRISLIAFSPSSDWRQRHTISSYTTFVDQPCYGSCQEWAMREVSTTIQYLPATPTAEFLFQSLILPLFPYLFSSIPFCDSKSHLLSHLKRGLTNVASHPFRSLGNRITILFYFAPYPLFFIPSPMSIHEATLLPKFHSILFVYPASLGAPFFSFPSWSGRQLGYFEPSLIFSIRLAASLRKIVCLLLRFTQGWGFRSKKPRTRPSWSLLYSICQYIQNGSKSQEGYSSFASSSSHWQYLTTR